MEPSSVLCLSSCTGHFSLEAIHSITVNCLLVLYVAVCRMDGPFTVGGASNGSNTLLLEGSHRHCHTDLGTQGYWKIKSR